MGRYLAQRVLALIPVSLGISIVVFAMIHLVPGDPAIALVGPQHTPETLAEVRKNLGLTAPVHVQYARWFWRALHGDLGTSIYLNRPVLPEVTSRFRASLLLASASFLIAIPAGIGIGLITALLRRSIFGRLMMTFAVVGISFPPFYLGMLLIIAFSVTLRWLPSSGMFPVTGEPTPLTVARHIILPALALAGAPFTVVARMVRASTLEVLRKEYVRTAHAKGLGVRQVIQRHVLKNALVPVIGLLGLQVGYLLSATALVEVVFGWPGLGSLIVQAILTRDLPLAQGSVLMIAVVYVLVNTVADIVQFLLDPRIKSA